MKNIIAYVCEYLSSISVFFIPIYIILIFSSMSRVVRILFYDDGYPVFPGSEKTERKEEKEDVLRHLDLED